MAEKIDGAPSVLYDAVAVVVTADGADRLSSMPPAKDFVTDAHAHAKFVALTEEAATLYDAAGVNDRSDGYIEIDGSEKVATSFLEACNDLRCWTRLA